jgi:tyrosyl-tRNA synthetase
LIRQGGAYVNGKRVEAGDAMLREEDFGDGGVMLRAGKKRFHRVVVS